MKNTPKIHSVIHIDCCIKVPAGNIFENDVHMFLVLFETVTKFKGFDLVEVVDLQVSLGWVEAKLVFVI